MKDETEAPALFQEYEVANVGTVIDPQGEPGYRIRTADGRVIGFPAHSGEPSEANAAADIAHARANPPPAAVPQAVTRRQFFRALLALGYTREGLRAMLGSEAERIEFDEALEIRRDHPLVVGFAATLGLTPAQADQLFRTASTL